MDVFNTSYFQEFLYQGYKTSEQQSATVTVAATSDRCLNRISYLTAKFLVTNEYVTAFVLTFAFVMGLLMCVLN